MPALPTAASFTAHACTLACSANCTVFRLARPWCSRTALPRGGRCRNLRPTTTPLSAAPPLVEREDRRSQYSGYPTRMCAEAKMHVADATGQAVGQLLLHQAGLNPEPSPPGCQPEQCAARRLGAGNDDGGRVQLRQPCQAQPAPGAALACGTGQAGGEAGEPQLLANLTGAKQCWPRHCHGVYCLCPLASNKAQAPTCRRGELLATAVRLRPLPHAPPRSSRHRLLLASGTAHPPAGDEVLVHSRGSRGAACSGPLIVMLPSGWQGWAVTRAGHAGW